MIKMTLDPICPLCKRPMPASSSNEHHLIPLSRKGKGCHKITLHKVCHDKLHHTISENEMAQHYHTIERLREHPDIAKFICWVRKQDPNFYKKHKDTKERNKKR